MAREAQLHLQKKGSDAQFVDRLSAILAKHHVLQDKEAASLRHDFDKSSAFYFEDFLVDEGLVGKEEVLSALSEYYLLPSIDVIGIFFDHHLVTMFPKDVMLRNGFIPYDRDGDVLIVVAARPDHPQLPEIIGKFVSYDVTFLAGLYTDICDAVKEFYDESIEQAELELFEDNRDEHEEDPLRDIQERIDE